MTPIERESKRFAGNVKVPWHNILATGRLLTGDYPSHLNPNCQGEWMLGDIIICECGFIGIDAVSRSIEHEGSFDDHSQSKNPAYTIELIRAELERVGKWGKFEDWLCEEYHHSERKLINTMSTPILLLQAANAYMAEERAEATYQTQQVMEDR